MREPLKIQLAIQGGGAKICALIAAAEALQELEKNGKIQITRLAGTSAGAIVACFLAPKEPPVSAIRQRLIDLGEAELRKAFPPRSRASMLARIMRGKPVYDPRKLREFLKKFFAKKKIGDLGRPVFIKAAHLIEGLPRSFTAEDDELVIDRLVDSCALPYVFRTWKNIGSYPLVDGGICENLPSDDLISGADEYGEVVAVSLVNRGVPEAPDGLVQFSLALIDTAINTSMERSKRSLRKGSIIPLDTHVSTFDFGPKMTEALDPEGDHYRRIKLEVEKWFEKTFLIQQDLAKQTTIVGDPWSPGESTPEGMGTMADLRKVYLQQHHEAHFEISRSALVITAYSLLGEGDSRAGTPDIVRQIVDLRPVQLPIYCYRLRLGAHPDAVFEDRASWTVRDARGEPIETCAFPMADPQPEAAAEAPAADEPQGPRPPRGEGEPAAPKRDYARDVLLFFLPPLAVADEARKPYTISQQTLVTGAMAPLRSKGRDGIANSNTRPKSGVERMDVVLYVPDSFPEIRWRKLDATGEIVLAPNLMTDRELRAYGEPPPGFRPLGWSAANMPPASRFGVILEVPDILGATEGPDPDS